MFDSKVHVLDHPLLQHKLSILRDERTGVKEFREIVSEIATLECYEATRDLPLEDVEIKTPVATGTFKCLTGKKLAIVPILRAGLGMVDGILTLIPSAKVGHIGLYRDPETLAAVSANVSANLLGLGNAATPLGIRAARRMARGTDGTADDELCRLVVLNTASLQLLPTTVAGVRAACGCRTPFDILPAVWLSSAISVTAGLLAARLLQRVWRD